MSFTLIVCTYKRPVPIIKLLDSIVAQTLYPNEIIIVDSSPTNESQLAVTNRNYRNLKYFLVDENHRGLTRQRNFGIANADAGTDYICFLDDDIITEPDYFEKLIATYDSHRDALGVGGYIVNETDWTFTGEPSGQVSKFSFDGWERDEPARFRIRKKLGLDATMAPGFSPSFSHGRSIAFLPPSGKVYEAEQLMGGVSSFKASVFKEHRFSTYFEGYGLYEDADFCIRVAKTGKLYVNTAARVAHYHAASGRPNQLEYGKMVVRNGWYVWRVKNKYPTVGDRLKWHSTTLLLAALRFGNSISTSSRTESFTEAVGRIAGWFSLLFKKPRE